MGDESYCYPGTDVLRNKLNIRDAERLKEAERIITAKRLFQLSVRPISGNFDLSHLQRIHGFIFQDVYEWAGKLRTVNIAKGSLFCMVSAIPDYADGIFAALAKESFLRNLKRDAFISRLAYFFAEVNALHPFREGNGRTQREFFRELSAEAGYHLIWEGVSEKEMLDASVESFSLRYEKLEALLSRVIQ